MKHPLITLMLLCFTSASLIYGQAGTITGTVTDAQTGEALPGASVSVLGTTVGTVSNLNGHFTLEIESEEAVLSFSYVGYVTREIPVAGKQTLDVALEPGSELLDELVVMAYGVSRKEAATGAVNVMKSEDIDRAIVTSPEKALQGQVAGVQINNYSGQPGGATEIYIRGISSLNSGNQPLYVIDGIPVISGNYGYSTTNSNIMATIDPSDIASMTVLKDAAAASVYGSRAANGVVLITTKSGQKGKTKFRLDTRYGTSLLAKSGDYRFMNPEELLEYHRDAVRNAGFDPDNRFDPQYYYPETLLDVPQTDWFKEVFRTGTLANVEMSASGGNDKSNFYISGGYHSEDGIMIGSGLERFNMSVNADNQLSDKVRIGTKIRTSYSKISDLPQQLYWASPIYAAQNLLPWESAYNEDGSINWDVPSNWNYNPVGVAKVNQQYDKFYRMISSLSLEWTILEGFTFKTSNSLDYLNGEGQNYWSPDMPDGRDVNGQIWNGLTRNYSMQTSNTLNFDRIFDDVHWVRLLVGNEVQYSKYSLYDLNAQGIGTQIPYISNTTKDLKDIDFNARETSLVSLFGILNYSYNDRYILSASIRGDGSSRFSPDNRWGLFYSTGLSWNLHNEAFMAGINAVNYMKLRLSYGTNGNYNIGDYQFYGTYTTGEYNNNQTSLPNRLPNNDLTWEKNNELNAGFDLVLFNRMTVNADFYNRITSDMLLYVQLPTTTGFSSQLRNTGKLSNTGLELSMDSKILNSGSFLLSAGFNVAHNKTVLLDLGGEEEILDSWNKVHRLNETFSQWYVYDWAGVNPLTGMGMWYDADGKLTEKYENARRVTKGQVQPEFVGGFKLNASWKGLSLNALFEFKTGHYVYVMESTYTKSDGWYLGHNQVASQLDYWKEPGDVVPVPKPIANNTSNSNAWKISRWIEKGNYLRFKQLNITYSLPSGWFANTRLGGLDVYAEAANITAWHDVSYWDPERSYNGDLYSTYPLARQVLLGLRLDF